MKAVKIFEHGDSNVLKVINDIDILTGLNDVKVKLSYSGINAVDTYIREGGYVFYEPELPYTPGFDGAGIVEEVGEEVTNFKKGDRVFIASALSRKSTGTYAETIVCHSDAIRRLPEAISFQQGAALGIPAVAAYRALFQRGHLKPGERVLIHGASGGVGTIAVQMAKSHGAFVIGTAGTQEGLERVKANGADLVLNHHDDNYLDGFDDIDLVVEMLANVNLEKDLSVMRQGGRILIIGNRGTLTFNPRLAMEKEADIRGVAIWNASLEEYKESLDVIEKMLEENIIHPEIGHIYLMEDVKKAQEDLINKPTSGKILLHVEN